MKKIILFEGLLDEFLFYSERRRVGNDKVYSYLTESLLKNVFLSMVACELTLLEDGRAFYFSDITGKTIWLGAKAAVILETIEMREQLFNTVFVMAVKNIAFEEVVV